MIAWRHDRFFVQFYSKIYNANPFYPMNLYELCNGFSDTWDFCTSIGEMLWVQHQIQPMTLGTTKEFETQQLPIKAKEVYISAYYTSQLHQAYLWALDFPDTTFIVGGPVALPRMFQLRGELPKNLILTTMSVEEFFGQENFSWKWRLELPRIEKDEHFTLAYTYTIDCVCYWGKCIFCNHSGYERKRSKLDHLYFPPPFAGRQRINIYSPAMTANMLASIVPQLEQRENVRYDIYLRSNLAERLAIENVLDGWEPDTAPDFKMIVGSEFPSRKMMAYIRKGFSVEDTLDMITRLSDRKNVIVSIAFILGWNCLEMQDILELESFMKRIQGLSGVTFTINKLFAKIHTPIHDTYEKGEERSSGIFYSGFWPRLNPEQTRLNDTAHDIIKSLAKGTVYDYYRRDS